jgi:ubiquitin-protein ligase
MASASETRRIRIANDYASMQNISRDWLQWRAVTGAAPYVEAYDLTLKVRTIIGPEPSYRSDHFVKIVIPANYPTGPDRPQAWMVTSPPPFHPNWFPTGKWCSGEPVQESLGEFVIRLIQTLQYNVYITNEKSPANPVANTWYLQKRNSGLFPCDRTPLPDPSTRQPSTSGREKARFRIK